MAARLPLCRRRQGAYCALVDEDSEPEWYSKVSCRFINHKRWTHAYMRCYFQVTGCGLNTLNLVANLGSDSLPSGQLACSPL
jgi:hypothetical protein